MGNSPLYIDEACFEDPEIGFTLKDGLQKLLGIFRYMSDQDGETVLSVNYWDIIVDIEGNMLYEILFSEDYQTGLSREDLREITQYFDRCKMIPAEKNEVEIISGDSSYKTFSGVYGIANNEFLKKTPYPIFLYRLSNMLSGSVEYSVLGNTRHCFFFGDISKIFYYYRHSMKVFPVRGRDFLIVAKKAYPNLIFHPDIDIDSLEINLDLHMEKVLHHLMFLNDEYEKLGISLKWDLPKLKLAAQARGVDFSDESSKTKEDKKKIKKRLKEFSLGGKLTEFSCSLHTKILPTMGRIHFHNPNEKSGGRILIGIFHKHLPI